MKGLHWIAVIAAAIIIGLGGTWFVNSANADHAVDTRYPIAAIHIAGVEVHAGTFEEPRLPGEPAFNGAVFYNNPAGQLAAFYIARFDSALDKADPGLPQAPHSTPAWSYAGLHSGIGPDLKSFDEPTRVGALHMASIDNRNALLRSKVDGVLDAQTPYPSSVQSNASWDFIDFFDKPGSIEQMKNDQDLMWPGVFVYVQPSRTVYLAQRSGHPVEDNWPAPGSKEGAGYWKYAGTLSDPAATSPKPWTDHAVPGSLFFNPMTTLRRYYYEATFSGFPVLLGAAFPQGTQSNDHWNYRGRHAGTATDPKVFGEPARFQDIYRAQIGGKWITLSPKFEGIPSAQTPYPVTASDNEFWKVGTVNRHAGDWQDPHTLEDAFSWEGAIHSQPQGAGNTLYRALESSDAPPGGWDYADTSKWQLLGMSIHAGTVADPKQQDELTWPGAVHVATLEGKPAYFMSMVEGLPAEHEWPLPDAAASNGHWTHIPVIKPIGTFEAPRQFDEYSQQGSVYAQGTIRGARMFYLSSYEGYPADDVDNFTVAGFKDPHWTYAGKHAGLLTDLKPFDDVTRIGAMHEAMIEGQRALLRSRFDGLPSEATPYPATLANNDHWEFVGVFKHAGTADDFKGNDELTWPGALHLDETRQIVFAANKQGEPGPDGWAYPTGETSDENWTYVTSLTGGTADAPRARNGLSTPGTIFADQHGLSGQKLWRARFTGFAQEVGAVYPQGTDSNGFYEYAGEHAGSFTDPKPFTEPTWPAAVHLAILDGQLTFLKSKIEGLPSSATPYPETPSSNEWWELAFSTEQAGTFADPKSMEGRTWPGAVHEYTLANVRHLYVAQQSGAPLADQWPLSSAGNSLYWKALGVIRHKGTFADPKDYAEVTSQGLIHTSTVDGQVVYYRSLVQGVPEANSWEYPVPGTDNEHWQYLGRNLPEGTWADPKADTGFTWPGRIHSVRKDRQHRFFSAKMDGVLDEQDWPFPDSGDNQYWRFAGASRHLGNFADPKDQDDVTWVGAIHMRQDPSRRMYYRAKFADNLLTGRDYPLPASTTGNGWWDYVGLRAHAGTLADPLQSPSEILWPGAIYRIKVGDEHRYYQARFDGENNHAIDLAPGVSNEYWMWLGKDNDLADGTVLSPNDALDVTWPGAIHRFKVGEQTHYVRSKIGGMPYQGWKFPAPPLSDESWDHVDVGIHAGTWDDLKPISDATWPGALHIGKIYLGSPPKWRTLFYRSKFWGSPSKDALYPPYSDPNKWEPVGASLFEGTLDSPKAFDQPTWRDAIHLDRATRYFFQALKSGEMDKELEPQPTTATSNASWRFLGVYKHMGTLNDPKVEDEYTWPGRIHRHEANGKILYFRAQMTGTPSLKNWPYPDDESSNDYWAYHGSTEHAGTFSDPHQRDEITWKGAIHTTEEQGIKHYFAAKRAGNPAQENWPYPTGATDNDYFRYIESVMHAGSISDPKELDELVTVGDYVRTQRGSEWYYYIAQNNGVPSQNDWPFPNGQDSNDHWTYYGVSRHAGTVEDPKEWDEISWRGAVHVFENTDMRMLFSVDSEREGLPEKEGWSKPRPELHDQEETDITARFPAWKYINVTHITGSLDNPKTSFSSWTEKGLFHRAYIAHQNMVFKAKFDGQQNYPADQPEKTSPTIDASTEWWEFTRKGQGTFSIPNNWNDYSRVGDINDYYYNGERIFFKAKKEGRPSAHNWYYPTSTSDNEYWEYLYKNEGTSENPKLWDELTEVNETHRYDHADNTLFFKARKAGNPGRHNWYYPTSAKDNDNWEYVGLHAGIWQDPKGWNEPTWPGAVHIYPERNLLFRSKFTGTPAGHNWYYPLSETDNEHWQNLSTNNYAAPGVNDLTRPFDQYTWVTAHNAYLDDITPQLQRGVRGLMIDVHMDEHPVETLKEVRVCHLVSEFCRTSDPLLKEVLKELTAYLNSDRTAVISLLFESTISYAQMKKVLEDVPEIANYSATLLPSNQWPTLQEMIDSNKRLVMIADRGIPGSYEIAGRPVTILYAPNNDVENTYNLGNTAINHDWQCRTRYEGMDLSLRKTEGNANRLFVLNQFHAWGSSTAHAGDMDNNLTWLQRRVERHCGESTGWRKPNFLAIDFNQVGDAFPFAAALSQGGLYFYERNTANRDGDTVCVLPGNQHSGGNGVQYDFKLASRGCENDEIRSMELDGIRAGTRIELYDSPDGNPEDDFTIIDVKQSVPLGKRVRIDSLEGSADTFHYRKIASHNNGLDGKISRIKVLNTPADNDISDARIVFKEGNNGEQNIVCTVPFDTNRQFKMGGGNSFGCDNDEIRSAVVLKAGQGSIFSVTGHPEGELSQGRAAVTFKRQILTPITIGSFNQSYENADVKVEVSHGGNLDGKISYANFRPAAEPEPEPEPEPNPGAPSGPANLRFENQWARPLKLMWNPSQGAVKYKVYKYFQQVGETSDTSLEYDHPDSVAGRYHVRAVDSQGRLSPKSAYLWKYPES